METIIHINGMSCEHCVKRVTKACAAAGVSEVSVSLEEKRIHIQHEGADLDGIIAAINDLGFEASL